MANPLFGVVAAARLDITAGSSSRAAYFALVVQYQFGTPVIHGRAPAELAVAIGVPFYSAVGDPGVTATCPGVVVVSFPNPTPSVVVAGVAYPVSTAVGGGTLVGVNYRDANGVVHPDVDWEWQISVEAYQAVAQIGAWNQAVIPYTGTGVNGRLVPTSFDLTQGRVAIWVFCQGTSSPVFRHSGMAGSGYATQPITLVGGVLSFGAGGFTVADDGGTSTFANQLGQHYTAVVLQDTTTDFRYMQVGDYPLWPLLSVINQIDVGSHTAFGQSSPPSNNDTGITAESLGQSLVAGGLGTIIPTVIHSTKSYDFSGPTPGSLGNFGIDGTPAARTITVPVGVKPLTQVWVVNRSGQAPFGTSEMAAPNSFTLGGSNGTITQGITALGAGQFTVGTDPNSNGTTAGHYYYVAFSIPVGDAVRKLFTTFKLTGTGGTVHVPLGFQPAFVAGRRQATGSTAAVWRSPWHAGTDSTQFDQTDVPSGGIVAFTATGFDGGSTLAPAAGDAFGFALTGAGTVAVYRLGATPVTPPPVVTPYVANACLGDLPVSASFGGTGCSADVPVPAV